jgi:hypothetical protein
MRVARMKPRTTRAPRRTWAWTWGSRAGKVRVSKTEDGALDGEDFGKMFYLAMRDIIGAAHG